MRDDIEKFFGVVDTVVRIGDSYKDRLFVPFGNSGIAVAKTQLGEQIDAVK